VAGRNSDNTFIKKVLGWEPSFPLAQGIERIYRWIEQQYRDRKAGGGSPLLRQRTVS
jgi:nucleoside-diphosphate-sugar epimerase